MLREPVLRRILTGVLVSSLGDGMAVVAVAWLAIQIAPVSQAGVWTGLAVAAYALPAALGTVVLAPLVRSMASSRLIALDAILRAVALGAVAALGIAGLLHPVVYVVLLAFSSLLHAWGNAGAYTLVSERLDGPDRVTGNALLSTASQASVVVGPALAGGIVAIAGPSWVIGLDALSFVVLAAVSWKVGRGAQPTTVPSGPPGSAWKVIAGSRQLLGLLVITCVFYFLYGPVEVALPLHVADDLRGSAGVLGILLAVFGVGALIGGLCAGLLPRRSPWLVVIVIIVGWGAALLPVGLSRTLLPAMIGMTLGGLIYGPYMAMSTELFQRVSAPELLSRVLAVRGAIVIPAVSLGTLIGGPIVNVFGAPAALTASALLTVALGLVLGLVVLVRRYQ
ncbi:hypothetical protein GCM10009765_67460 [Fodinicola feengrottensis]|uniref:MFS transporter n=1 Tax=Fodinicola feengrottensis TaxID=435914 RepID=A0ABN2IN92_9ACTN